MDHPALNIIGGNMRIPVIYADEPTQVTLANAGQGWKARGAAADEAGNLMETISKHQAALQEQERLAQDTLAAIETDNAMRKKFAATVESVQGRTDTAKFNPDFDKASASIKNEFYPANASKERQIAFARSYNQNDSNSRTQVTSMKYKVMEESGRIAIGESMDNYADQYAAATDDATKKIISKQAELDIRKAIDSNLVNRVWGENQIRNLESSFKQKEIDLADVEADQAIMANPGQASIDLRDSKYIPNLTPKQRQDKLEKAVAAYKVQKNQRDSELKEAKKIAHDKEKGDIADLYMNGDYTGAFIKTLDNKLLEPEEIITLSDKIRSGAEAKRKPAPVNNALDIITINGMIERNEDPSKIRDFIAYNQNFEKEDKEQYINKLDTKLNAQIKDGRNRGYRDIVNIIFPRAFDLMSMDPDQLSESDIGKILNSSKISPEQIIGIAKTQTALDSWIETMVSSKKYPSSAEIRAKALALVGEYQMSIGEKVEFWRKQSNQ